MFIRTNIVIEALTIGCLTRMMFAIELSSD